MESSDGKDQINKEISNAAKALQKVGAKKAGINRWIGRTMEEKKAHSKLMTSARWGNRPGKNG